MPIYEYECTECNRRIERLQRLDDPGPEECEHCGGAMRRAVSAPAFQFKGSGWYVTDYADRKSSDGDSSSDSSGDKASSEGGDKGGGETPAASTPAKKESNAKAE